MSSRKNDGWVLNEGKFDFDAHARDLEKVDVFNRFTDDTASIHLKSDLLKLAASDNPDAVAVLREAGIESPHTHKPVHLSDGTVGEIFADASGVWHAIATIADQRLDFSGDDRDGVMMAAESHLQKNKEPRELTESELLRLARLTESGGTAEACALYVELRLDGKDRRSATEILEDPRYRPLLDEAAITIWRFSRRDYVFDQEFEDLIVRAAAMRPLSVNTVDCLYDKFEMDKAQNARSTRPPTPVAEPETERQPAPSAEEIRQGLESLTDEQLEKLRAQSLRHRADLVRRFNARMGAR